MKYLIIIYGSLNSGQVHLR